MGLVPHNSPLFSPYHEGGAGFRDSSFVPRDRISAEYVERLVTAVRARSTANLSSTLTELLSDTRLSSAEKTAIVDAKLFDGASLVHCLARFGFGRGLFPLMAQLGCDFDKALGADARDYFSLFGNGCTAMHIAAVHQQPQFIRRLATQCKTPAKTNDLGEDPLLRMVQGRGFQDDLRRHVTALLELGCIPSRPAHDSQSALAVLLNRYMFSLAQAAISYEVANKHTYLTRSQVAALVAVALSCKAPAKLCNNLGSLTRYAKSDGPNPTIGILSDWRESLARYVHDLGGDDPQGKAVVTFLQNFRASVPGVESTQIYRTLVSGSVLQLPLIVYLATRPNRSINVIRTALQLGVPTNVSVSRIDRADGQSVFVRDPKSYSGVEALRVVHGLSPLHLAALSGDGELGDLFLEAGVPVGGRDSLGATPLRLHLLKAPTDDPSFVAWIVEAGALRAESGSRGETLVELALRRNRPLSLAVLVDHGSPIPAKWRDKRYTVPERGIDHHYNFIEATQRFADLLERLDLEIDHEQQLETSVRTALRHSGDLRVPLLALEAFFAATYDRDGVDSFAYTELLPHVLGQENLEVAAALAKAVDLHSDSHQDTWNKAHPNEAEWMAVLANPYLDHAQASQHTLAISSSNRFRSNGISDFSEGEVDVWRAIGIETFNHRRWRFDVQGARVVRNNGVVEVIFPSLFEQFGMERIPPNPAEQVFGAGFVARQRSVSGRFVDYGGHIREPRQFDPQTMVIPRRGYRVVSHPCGTLLIRNSSPVFGRDLLPYPAYLAEAGIGTGFNSEHLEGLTRPQIEESFIPITDVQIFSGTRTATMHFLLSQLRGFEQIYSSWKYDTARHTAWMRPSPSDEAEFVGGPYSPGFTEVLAFLERRIRECTKLGEHYSGGVPDLCFVSPMVAPWIPLARLRVDGDVLRVLKEFAEVKYLKPDTELKRKIWEFFAAGSRSQGDLVLLAREEKAQA